MALALIEPARTVSSTILRPRGTCRAAYVGFLGSCRPGPVTPAPPIVKGNPVIPRPPQVAILTVPGSEFDSGKFRCNRGTGTAALAPSGGVRLGPPTKSSHYAPSAKYTVRRAHEHGRGRSGPALGHGKLKNREKRPSVPGAGSGTFCNDPGRPACVLCASIKIPEGAAHLLAASWTSYGPNRINLKSPLSSRGPSGVTTYGPSVGCRPGASNTPQSKP